MTAKRWFKELYDAHSPTLYRLAANRLLRLGGNAADAQDVLQDVFRLAMERDIRSHPNPYGWLIKATENICKNYARKYLTEAHRHTPTTVSAADTTYDLQIPIASEEPEADVFMMLENCLTEEEQHIVYAYCLENHSVEDIAASLGVTPNTLNVRIFRIRKRLKKFFSEHV